MSERVIIGGREIGCCEPCTIPYTDCCQPLPMCPPKKNCCEPACMPLKARNAVRLSTTEIDRWFSFKEACQDSKFNVMQHSLSMSIRRVSCCDPICTITPHSVDAKGKVLFRWPNSFLNSPSGYYEATLFVDCTQVLRVLLHKPFKRVSLKASDYVETNTCIDGCTQSCCGVRPEMSMVPDVTIAECGGCGAGCK